MAWWPFLRHIWHLCLRLYISLWRLVFRVEQLHWKRCSKHLRIVWPKWPHHPQRFCALRLEVRKSTITGNRVGLIRLVIGKRGILALEGLERLRRLCTGRTLGCLTVVCVAGGCLTGGCATGGMGLMPIFSRSSWQNWWPQGSASITGFFSRHMAHSFSELNRRRPHAGLSAYDFLHMGHLFIVWWLAKPCQFRKHLLLKYETEII